MTKNIFLFGSLCVALSACSHLSGTVPVPLVEPPELAGKENLTVSVDVTASNGGFNYVSTTDASARPPDLTNPRVEQYASTRGGVSLEALKRLRLGAGVDVLNFSSFLTGQFQVLGDGRSTAKQGNFSLSLFAHVGSGSSPKNGDQNGTFGPGGYPWSAKLGLDWYDYGLSVGYRTSDSATIFIGGSKGKSKFETSIDQTQGGAPTGTYTASDKGEAWTGSVGAVWGSGRGELFVIGGHSEGKFEVAGFRRIDSITLGARLDFR